MEKIDGVNYDDYKYKSFVWKEDGRHEKPRGKTKRKTEKTAKNRKVIKADKQALFVVATIVLCFSLTFVLATLAGKGSVMNFFEKGKNTDGVTTYYVVCSDVFSDESLARISADEARVSGGAGYIIYDKKYYLALACYKTKEDAEKVRKRLNGNSACIYEINIKKPSLAFCDEGKKEAVERALKYENVAFSRLYELSVSYDDGSMTESQVKSNLKTLSSEIRALSIDIDKMLKNKSIPELIKIKAEIKACEAVINNVATSRFNGLYLSAGLRFATLSIVNGYKNLATEL